MVPCPALLSPFHGGRQGCGPNRGQSPVEWGDFPSVTQPGLGWLAGLQIWLAGPQAWLAGPQAWLAGPQVWLGGPQAWLAGPQAWLARPQAWLDGPEGGTDGWMDKQKISPFYRTSSPIGAAAQKGRNL